MGLHCIAIHHLFMCTSTLTAYAIYRLLSFGIFMKEFLTKVCKSPLFIFNFSSMLALCIRYKIVDVSSSSNCSQASS